jgi:predicted RNA binding protein YcfA (HicA-like mRNA interferase family)
MSELPRVSGLDAVSAFEKFGFVVVRTSGSHHVMKKAGHRYNLAVPVYGNKNVKSGTLRSLITDAGITVEEFQKALD